MVDAVDGNDAMEDGLVIDVVEEDAIVFPMASGVGRVHVEIRWRLAARKVRRTLRLGVHTGNH